MRSDRSTLYTRAGLIALVAAAFLLRLWGLTRMHYWDENIYLLNAQYIFSGHAGYTEIDSRPPLLPLLFAAVFHLWHSDYAAQIVTALINALAPALLFLAGRKIVARSAAAVAALLLALAPTLAGVCPDAAGTLIPSCNSHSLMTDYPALTCILFAFLLLLRALERESSARFALAGVALAAAVLMRFGGISSVAVLSLLCFAAHRKLHAILACAAGFILGMAPYLAWSRLNYGGFFTTLRLGWLNLGGASEPALYFVKDAPNMFTWLALAGLAAALILLLLQIARQPNISIAQPLAVSPVPALHWQLFLFFWLAVVLLFFSCISHKEQRYDIPLAPPLFLLAGTGLTAFRAVRSRTLRSFATAALALALLATFAPDRRRFTTPFFDPARSNEMLVSDFIRTSTPPSTILYANENYPDFAWYTGHTVEDLPEAGPTLYTHLQQLAAGSVLIAYKSNDDDTAGAAEPSIAFLDSDPRLTRLQEFPTLILYTVRGAP